MSSLILIPLGMLLAYLLKEFAGVDGILIQGFYELFKIRIGVSGYYTIFFIISTVIALFSSPHSQ